MTLRTLSLFAALGTAAALLVAFLMLRFGVYLPYAERQVLLAQNQELSRLNANLSSWLQELELQSREWVLTGASHQPLSSLGSSLVSAAYRYDNSLVLTDSRFPPELQSSVLDGDEGFRRARLLPLAHPQLPRFQSGWLTVNGRLYGYSSASVCRRNMVRCDDGFLLLLRHFTQTSLAELRSDTALNLSLRPAQMEDLTLPKLPLKATELTSVRELQLPSAIGNQAWVFALTHHAIPPDRYSRSQWLVLLVALLPAAFIYALLLRLVAKPMERGVSTLRSMERNQQHRSVSSPSLLVEFQQLAKLFNQLLRRLAQQQDKLSALNRRDPLTGLANGSALQQFLAHEWRRCGRYRRGLALILIEITPTCVDGISGNSEEAAVILGRHLKTFSRRGGELAGRDSSGQFALVVPELNEPQLQALVDELLNQLDGLAPFNRQPPRVTLSIGVALVPAEFDLSGSGLTLADWQDQARNALYRCKQHGVGRYQLWSAVEVMEGEPSCE